MADRNTRPAGIPVSNRRSAVKLIPLILFIMISAYYGTTVLIARVTTEKTVVRHLEQAKIMKEDLSAEQLKVLLKIQDPGFYEHRGVDFRTPGNGWTTISQSLAKQFYFDHFKQGIRKIKQTLCARFALDPLVSKDDQITLFLNMMYFGNQQTGIVDAAHYYYAKETADLSDTEYISLIGSLISPNTLNPEDHPEANRQRVEKIRRMLSGEYTLKGLFDITYDRDQGISSFRSVPFSAD